MKASDNESIFMVEEDPEGGYVAYALGQDIVTQGDTMKELHEMVRDAVRCHFDEGRVPAIVRLHFVREDVITT